MNILFVEAMMDYFLEIDESKFAFIAGLIFIGMILLLSVVGCIKEVAKCKRCTDKVEATIQEVRRERTGTSKNRHIRYYASCTYEYKGRQCFADKVEVSFNNAEGELIDLYINPNNTEEFVVGDNSGKEPLIGYGFMTGFMLIFLIIWIIGGVFATDGDEDFEDEYEEAHYEQIVETEKPKIINKKEYCGVSMELPQDIITVIYDNEDVNSGKCILYNMAGDQTLRLITANNNTNIDIAYNALRNLVNKQGKNIKAIDTVETNGIKQEIYRMYISSDDEKNHTYYAISANDKKRIMIKYNGELESFKDILNTISY